MSPSLEIPSATARPGFERADTDVADKTKSVPHDDPEYNLHTLNHKNDSESTVDVEQDDGVTKIEALYLVFGNGWKLWLLWGSIALVAIGYCLSSMTTYYYAAFATSAFGEHTIVGTIATITGIMAGVAKPFIAKLADLFSRPWALAVSVFFYAIGYIIVASAQNVSAVAGGQVVYTLGNTGIDFVLSILFGDITSLQYRGLVNGLYSLPYIPFAFVGANISAAIGAYSVDGWRWGYGMFIIIIPVIIAPALFILFWADQKAKRIGALSLASSSYARRQVLAGLQPERRSAVATVLHYARQIDAVGLLLLGFAFGCILSPFTLYTTAAGGYTNPSLIALLTVGGILFIACCVWEWKFASHPIMPRRIFNKTFMCCIGIDFNYYFSGYLSDTYWSSWLYVVHDYSDADYGYILNILTVGLCGFGTVAGLCQRYFHRYKWFQMFGLAIRCVGMGLQFACVNGHNTTAVIVLSRIFIGIGGGFSVISSQVAAQASVPHADMALSMSILSLWTSIGGAIASAIAASVWNAKVPANLEKYLGSTYNSTEIAEIFGSIAVARVTEPRSAVVQAYNDSVWGLYLAGMITSFLSLIAGFITSNYYLDQKHNIVEDKEIKFRNEDEVADDVIAAKAREVEEKIAQKVMAGQ
uniref:Predicted protein n=1 Tax=Hordeum vulgare subsp. vulgare TaxID=112509 RepID=F2EEJ7_HORVV|nr:predicted protein [Hordeum vulgare subsp. vulgare]